MNIIRQKYIDRSDLQNNPHLMYVFGDNVNRVGRAGQAAAMRGEKNAYGIATLMSPGVPFRWSVIDRQYILRDLIVVFNTLSDYTNKQLCEGLVWPTDGIGTGFAKMPPTLRAWMDDQIFDMFGIFNELK